MSIVSSSMQWASLEAERNGRNKYVAFADMAINYLRYGVFPQEYYHYGFYRKNAADKRTYFTTRLYQKRRAQLSDSRYEEVIFQDKYVFAQVFHDYYGRRCLLVDSATPREKLKAFVAATKKVVYKLLDGCEGGGVRSFSLEDYKTADECVNEILGEGGTALLDEWLTQSEEMNRFYSKGVNCIRVYTFLHDGHFEFLDAKVSFGTDSDIVNATLTGNLFATVDVNTGVITSDLTDYTLALYKQHPVTRFTAKGTQLPQWERVLALAENAAYRVPQVAYVGWDIALTEEGPVLIEGNHCGGCGGNQFCTLSDSPKGKKNLWDVAARM